MSAAEAEQYEQQWRVSHRGREYGRFTQGVLRAQILAGRIAPDAELSREGQGDRPISVAEFLGTQRVEPLEVAPADPNEIRLADEVEERRKPEPPRKPALTPREVIKPADDPLPMGVLEPLPETGEDTHLAMAVPAPDPAPDPLPEPLPASFPAPPVRPQSSNIQQFGHLWWETTPAEDGAARDRIVILGRRQSGKTIYLSALYASLWGRLTGLGARALTGAGHRQLMGIANTLRAGAWPAATQGSMELPLEIEFEGLRQQMVVLDFAGELFTKAFFRDQTEAREVTQLLNHIDHAAAVILLVDPMVTVGLDREAVMEDDFGLVNAVRRIRQSPGGEDVPVVFVLTKADVHADVVNNAGGLVEFVRRHFASLARLLGQLQIYQVSAIQTEPGPNGRPMPRGDSRPFNIDKPLIYCMQTIARQNREREERARREAAWEAHQKAQAEEERVQRQQNHRLRVAVTLIGLAGIIAVLAIMFMHDMLPFMKAK